MDAHALLTSQGWRGSGHSLHPSSATTGLRRPLLISQKKNVLGIGKKQHRTSDMWWQNAFDSSLKGLDTSKEGKVVQTITNGGLDMVKKGGGRFVGSAGLYACFVQGDGLSGTLKSDESGSEVVVADSQRRKPNGKSRKDEAESKEERRARKAARRAARQKAREALSEEPPKPESQSHETSDQEDQDEMTVVERKERKRKQKLLRQQDSDTVEAQNAASHKKKKRRKESDGPN